MTKKFRISEKAVEDLENIWFYTLKKWSQDQADRYYKLLITGIELISTNFEIGKSMDHIKPGYRVSKVRSHLIFYRKSADEVTEIIRILHQQMDIENRLK